jgi:TonB family protein
MTANLNSLVPAILRVTVFLLAAGLLSLALRHRTAAVRHLVWTSALAGALAIPFLSGALPRWTIPVWADLVPAQGAALFRVDAAREVQAAARPLTAAVVSPTPASTKPASRTTARDWRPAVIVIWWMGALAVLVQTLLGTVAVIRLKRRALPARPPVAALARELSLEMGLGKETRVLTTQDATTPMTWGIFRPVILLPAVLVGGDPDRLRAVLLHELAHVARRDYVLHLLAQAACALYWFHPLVWLARREALRMRERASDDVVLNFGVRPADYAESLVQLSRSLAVPKLCAGLGITRCSNLEKRIRAILDPSRRRGRLTPAWALLAVVAAGSLALAVGVVEPALAEIPPLPLLAPVHAALPAFALASSPAPAMQAAIPGSDLATLEAQAASAAKAYNFEQALALYRKAAEMTKAIASDNSPQYAAALMRLGALCRAWDRWEPAHGYYSQAIPILERVFGPSYFGLAEPLYFLAMEAEINKDLPRAESLYQRVLDLHQSPPGPETSLAAMGRARALRGLGRDDEANVVEQEIQPSRVFAEIPAPIPANPDVSGAYRVGGGVTAPSLIYKTEPGYSQEARITKVQGTVVLQIVVGVDGVPGNISVVRQLGFGLDQKAVETIRQWRFNPGAKDGVPVPVSAQVEVNFRLL